MKNRTICFIVFLTFFSLTVYSQTIIDYQRLTFTGTYQSISGTAGPSGDDYAENYSLPFPFHYIDHTYDLVRICTNGWIELGSASRPLSFSISLSGGDLFSSFEPNKTLAPWWADLGAFNNPVEYTTLGSSPERIFVVQWRDVNSPFFSSRLINFQIRLYETTNIIEFWYGSTTSGDGSFEFASFGIEDEIGGSGHFIDGPTGSNTIGTTNLNSYDNWPTLFYRFLPAPVKVVRPNGGEFFSIGYPDTIKWVSTVSNVKIEYSTNSGSNWNIIESSFPSALGKYVWTVPNTPTNNALVKLTDAINDSVFDVSDDVFIISDPPIITVLPDSFSFVLNEGDSSESLMQISNTGLGNLNYEISIEELNFNKKKQNFSSSNFSSEWENKFIESQRYRDKNFRREIKKNYGEQILPLIVSDPVGDAQFVDIIQVRGRSTEENIELEFIFETELNPFDFGGFLGLDTDQNLLTGSMLPNGLPEQEVGCEFFVYFFSLGSNLVDVYDQFGNYLGSFPADYDTRSFRFSVPLSTFNNDDGIMNIAAVVGNSSGPTDWIPDQGYGILGGNSWLTLEPLSGTIIPGNNEKVTVKINTDRIDGGEYYANILINSNDPVNSLVIIPVHLTVVGQPNLVATDSVQFGQVYVGYPESAVVELKNNGSVTLEVTDIISSNPLFNVSLTNFSILPNDTALLIVSFNPATTGPESGTLSIISNDPSSPAIINLFGEGVFPPVISVTPDSFFYDLNVGDSVVTQLTIENTGLGELVYQITDRQISGASAKIKNPYRLKAPVGKNEASLKKLLGKEVISFEKLITKIDHKVNDRYNPDLPVLVIDPIGDGGIVDIKEIRGTVINNNLEIEYVFADGINISDSLIAYIFLDIDRNPLTGAIDPFYFHDLGVDYFVYYFPISFGNQIVIIEYSTGNQYSVPYNINGTTISYSVPLSILGNDDGEMDLLAVAVHYSVADIDWAPDEGHITLADAFWLSENPNSGIIQPGSSAVIEISANTSQLIGGNYLATINFSSNDPLNPSLEVPFTMHLTGVPQITLSDDTLDFGETYIGYYHSLSFAISSVGTDSLIGNIISSDPEFTLVDSLFAIPVGGVKNIEVQFHPADTGFSATTLIINSNAGIVPLNVYLTGNGVIAPNILTDTTSFYFAANTGDTLQSYFTIFNSGGSDLTVEIRDEVLNRSSERLFGAEFNTIYEIDPNNGTILNSFPTPTFTSGGPTALAYSGKYLFFTDAFNTTDIFVLDPVTGNIITSYIAPTSGSNSIDGLAYIEPFLYAQDYSASQIYKLNPDNGSVVQVLTPPVFIGGGLDGGASRLFASDFSLNIYELNPDNGSLINSFQTQQVTYGIGFTGERIFTSVPGFGIDEYDPNTGQYIRTISTSGYSALAGGGNPDAEWLTETPNLVTVPAGGNAEINITVSANELSIGQYSAQIVLESNDPDSTTLTIPVTLDIITGVGNEEELPKSYSLHQNYPNPFNPATTIKYELPKEVYVVLTVYNILGQEVETLVNSVQQAGRYEIYWDASDLASGFYIYRIEARGFVEAKKLILMK